MPPLKSDVWTWDTLIHIAIIIAVAIIARWLLRKGVDWTIHLMVSRSEKREATMPGRVTDAVLVLEDDEKSRQDVFDERLCAKG